MSFVPLEDYSSPSLPTEEWLRGALRRLRLLLGRDAARPYIADDRLERATLDVLEDVVAPPACGPLLDALDGHVGEWLGQDGRQAARPRLKLFVLPPCENRALLQSWAERTGHALLAPPSREALLGPDPAPLPALDGDALLVVPRLEDWFLRHRLGLRAVRLLLAALEAGRRPVLIGCNSFAWRFLCKAIAADNLLPPPLAPAPFDDKRLLAWFGELSEADSTSGIRFRRASSGADVLEPGEDGAPRDDYLRLLAGHSLGIPWVAWHLWRHSLRSAEAEADEIEPDGGGEATDAAGVSGGQPREQQTLWVAALDQLNLPDMHDTAVFLVLHALLIHGPLSAEQLRLVLPLVGQSTVVSLLLRAGLVERREGLIGCTARAYPAVRTGLRTAGLPLGAI